jgi:PHD/YefM family antitoxin component YafN of YafNO toxin-antitoxin module
MTDRTPDAVSKTLHEQGGRYVVDSMSRPVAVLLTLEEYEHYLDLLDDEEDSQDRELQARLTLAAETAAASQADAERLSLRDYLRQRPPADASLQD